MSSAIGASRPIEAARDWTSELNRYRQASAPRSLFELAVTFVPFALLWAALLAALSFRLFWLYPLLLVPAAGLLVRLFMIQHDCGHGSFFPSKAGNDWTGRVIGILTMTP